MNVELFQIYGPAMLVGLLKSLQLVALSALLGAAFAIPMALARNSSNRALSGFARSYIVFFRGTPLLAQLFLIYYGAGQLRQPLQGLGVWWIFRDAFTCAVFAFTLNTVAYQAEIVRGALSSLPRGQIEAAQAIGLKASTAFWHILMPQALVVALRPLGNELILSLKASALASIVTVPELMQVTKLAFSRSFDFQVYLWAAVLYLVVVEAIRRLWNAGEARLTRHLRVSR